MIHLDTHVVAWLWAGDDRRLKKIKRVLEANELIISPMVQLELQALCEIGRTRDSGQTVVAGLCESIGLRVSAVGFASVVDQAGTLSWTRDPFDRLIVATALAEGARLLTIDEAIRSHYARAFWP